LYINYYNTLIITYFLLSYILCQIISHDHAIFYPCHILRTDYLYMTVKSIYCVGILYIRIGTLYSNIEHTYKCIIYCVALVRNRTICFHMMQLQMYNTYIRIIYDVGNGYTNINYIHSLYSYKAVYRYILYSAAVRIYYYSSLCILVLRQKRLYHSRLCLENVITRSQNSLQVYNISSAPLNH